MQIQIRTLQSVLITLLLVLGFNAFTSPSYEQDPTYAEITEGKIRAVEEYQLSLTPKFHQAQKDYQQMNMAFESLAMSAEDNIVGLSQLSQVLYVYEQEIKFVDFKNLSVEKQEKLIDLLASIQEEFYIALASVKSANK